MAWGDALASIQLVLPWGEASGEGGELGEGECDWERRTPEFEVRVTSLGWGRIEGRGGVPELWGDTIV